MASSRARGKQDQILQDYGRRISEHDDKFMKIERLIEQKFDMLRNENAARGERALQHIDARLGEMRTVISDKHARLRHDVASMQTQVLALIEEKGRNDARHEENKRVLERLDRWLGRQQRDP